MHTRAPASNAVRIARVCVIETRTGEKITAASAMARADRWRRLLPVLIPYRNDAYGNGCSGLLGDPADRIRVTLHRSGPLRQRPLHQVGLVR